MRKTPTAVLAATAPAATPLPWENRKSNGANTVMSNPISRRVSAAAICNLFTLTIARSISQTRYPIKFGLIHRGSAATIAGTARWRLRID
jgi:hypothetical protein